MHHRIPLSVEVKRVLKLLMYTMFALLFSASAYFFVKMSSTTESGYAFRENQIRQNSLESENRLRRQRVLDAQSLYEVKTSNVVEKMTEPDSKTYVEPKGPISKRK